ncbi:MAG TPA: SDR family oxidoreductase [Candidatus Saccharimonadales bacterium]|nr:SDR family oxidoreductase [Candidatus Saccharimonadales bacterium]
MKQLEGKVAVVTGASTGIGKGIAQTFVREGAKVVLASRNEQGLKAVADQLRPDGTVLVVPTDVRHESEVVSLFEKTMREFERLDILVNNAGIFRPAPLDETTLEAWQATMDTNLTGPFLCTREAVKIMKLRGGGRIINIGSISAQMPRPNGVAYSCSKAGLVSLTRTTALMGRNFGIVAGCIHPGNTNTELMTETPNEPMMETNELVRAVLVMATLPPDVNMLEAIVLPATQLYLGRG